MVCELGFTRICVALLRSARTASLLRTAQGSATVDFAESNTRCADTGHSLVPTSDTLTTRPPCAAIAYAMSLDPTFYTIYTIWRLYIATTVHKVRVQVLAAYSVRICALLAQMAECLNVRTVATALPVPTVIPRYTIMTLYLQTGVCHVFTTTIMTTIVHR